MRRFLLTVLFVLFASSVFSQTPLYPSRYTVSSGTGAPALPAASSLPNKVVEVIDSATGSCGAGGGSIRIWCHSDGSSWSSVGDGTGSGTSPVTNVSGVAPIASSGGATPAISLNDTAVTPGSYTYGGFTVDAKGRLTAASSGTSPLVPANIGSTVQAWDADLDAIAALSGTGFARRTGTNTWSVSNIASGDLPGSFSGFANPSAQIGLTTVNGSATTAMRSDAAPALNQGIIPTWTAAHTFSVAPTFSAGATTAYGAGLTWNASANESIYGSSGVLQFSAAGSEKMRINSTGLGVGTTSPAALVHFQLSDAATNTQPVVLTLRHQTSGTSANNFGELIQFVLESADGVQNESAYIKSAWDDAGGVARRGRLVFSTANGTSPADNLILDADGRLSLPNGHLQVGSPAGFLSFPAPDIGLTPANSFSVGISYGKTITITDNTYKEGVHSTVVGQKTSAAFTKGVEALEGEARVGAANTQNWTNTPVSLYGTIGGLVTEAGATGTITGIANLYGYCDIQDGATITNWYGVYLQAPTVANSKLVNAYGIYIPPINSATGNNYAIYSAAGLNYLGGSAIFGSNANPETNYTSNLGAINKKYLSLHAAELVVETLVAQQTQATIGGRVLVIPTNTFTVDVAPGDTTITVKYNNFVNGSSIRSEADGKVEFMTVTSTASGSAGAYVYSVTRNADGSGANQWYAGDAAIKLGTTGDGFIDLYSTAGVLSGTGPTIVCNVKTGTAYNAIDPRCAVGNLNGVYGYSSDIYGAAFGSSAGAWIKVDPTNGVRIGFNSTTNTQIDASGNASFSGAVTANSGSIGSWVINSSAIQNSGATVMLRGAGNLAFGSTPPTSASAGTGVFIDPAGMVGLLSNVVQTKLDATTGAITAGAGNVKLDSSGVAFTQGVSAGNKAKWLSGTDDILDIYGQRVGSPAGSYGNIAVRAGSSDTAAQHELFLTVFPNTGSTGNEPVVNLVAYDSGFIGHASKRFIVLSAADGVTIGPGISTLTEPNALLDVRGSLSVDTDLFKIQDTNANDKLVGMLFASSAGPTAALRAKYTNPASTTETEIQFYTNPSGGSNNLTQKMTIVGNGNVGIGTATPAVTLEVNGISKVKIYTVAGLPTCNGGSEGSRAGVSNALAPAFLTVVVGGGTVHSPVYCDGTSWIAF